MEKFIFCCFACLTFLFSNGQIVTHGPIVGGVTQNSARVFVRTSAATAFEIQISDDDFASVYKTVSGSTLQANDYSGVFDVPGLSADTRYKVRVMINSAESGERATVKTFPPAGQAGHYKFLFGSCIYELSDTDSSLFVQMLTEDANVFTPTGDWGYPDKNSGANDLYLSNPPTSWAVDYNKIRDIYKERYTSSNSGFFYRSIAMDYTHDDHDYLNDNTGRNVANIFGILTHFGEPISVSQPPQARLNCIRAYQELFPHYPLVDTSEGIFHSYTMGNCEIFVLDTRSARSPQHEAIKEVGGKWVLQEPPGHSILGQVQMQWLLNGLLHSTADWKIIVSSVVFNKGYKAAMDSLLTIGKGNSPILGIDAAGIHLSTGLIGAGIMSDSWVGFPTDQDTLINHIKNNHIRNVFIVSGDAHTAALDDGTNSGIPELLAANLKKANSQDAVTFSNFLGYWVWNLGASGLSTSNLNNTYGKVEVFGKDSIRLSAVDASGTEVVGHTFYEDSLSTGINKLNSNSANEFLIYPNPASKRLYVKQVNGENRDFNIRLISPSGKEILHQTFNQKTVLDIDGLPTGYYIFRILNPENREVQSGKLGFVQ